MDLTKIQEVAQQLINDLNNDIKAMSEQVTAANENRLRLEGAVQGIVLLFNKIDSATNKPVENDQATPAN